MADLEVKGVITGSLTKIHQVTGELSVPKSRVVYGDYNRLDNRPTINAVMVDGDKVSDDYHLQGRMETMSQQEIEKILYVD